ncbi:MAG: dihydroorotase family protein [Candidatus Altiarchaeota archaeon]|nr:dihydroorotase family protein [Candidatus Altiarchaeota archaeon]
MMAELVIKNSRLVLPEGVVDAGLVIGSGKIENILKDSALPDADTVIDAEGNYILPGMIDVHVHMREPGAVSKEGWVTGSKAAAAGGVTTLFDMPNTQPPTTSIDALAMKRENVNGKSLVDYGFHLAATPDNQGELKKLSGDIASVKFYTCSTVGSLLIDNDAVIFEDFRILEGKQLISTVHAENQVMIDYWMNALKESGKDITPLTYAETRGNICAGESLNSLIYLSKSAGNKLHVAHVSTLEEVNLIRKFKDPQLTAEVSPHHLFLSLDDVGRLGSYSRVNPPLRSEVDKGALWEGLFDGTIDMIASDHAPHLRESKEKDVFTASAGFPELETTLPLLLNETHNGRLTLELIAKITAENPARVFRVKNKGRIEKGFDADLVIVDLDRERRVREDELFTKCGWSPYAGRNLKGWPVKTFVGGNLVFDEGIIYEEKKGGEVNYY